MDEKTLIQNLNNLKYCILNFTPDKKIIFFDKNSYYNYLKNVRHGSLNVKEILDKIYRSIPLLLTDEAYETFLSSLSDPYDDSFEVISKTDFFDYAVSHINNWDYIVWLCLGINKYLE